MSECDLYIGIEAAAREIHLTQSAHAIAHLGKALSQANELLVLLGKRSAAERMASFLLNLSGRPGPRGLSHREFSLTMTRHDVGNYLGLALGTVCRLLAELQEYGILSVRERYIHIHEVEYLRAIVGLPVTQSAAGV